jgi:20S proteasome alpha/beta subunit
MRRKVCRYSTMPHNMLFVCFRLGLLFISLGTTFGSQAAGTETLIGIVGKDFILLGADSSVSQSISLTASNLDKIASLSEPFFYDDARSADPCQQQTIVAAAAGDAADSDRLVGLLQAHSTIQEYQSGVGCDVVFFPKEDAGVSDVGLDVEAMASLARGQIASSLRSRTPLRVCLLIAGMMSTNGVESSSSSFVSMEVQEQVRRASSGFSRSIQNSNIPDKVVVQEGIRAKLEPRLYWLDEYGSMQKIEYGAHGHASNFCLSILDQGFKPDMSQEEAIKLLRDCFQQLRTRYIINSPQPPCIKCVDSNGVRLIP